MAKGNELLLYFYLEYGTTEAEEERKIDLPIHIVEVFGKILTDRIKDKTQVPLFSDGVLSYPEIFLDSFTRALAFNSELFMGVGIETPRH